MTRAASHSTTLVQGSRGRHETFADKVYFGADHLSFIDRGRKVRPERHFHSDTIVPLLNSTLRLLASTIRATVRFGLWRIQTGAPQDFDHGPLDLLTLSQRHGYVEILTPHPALRRG